MRAIGLGHFGGVILVLLASTQLLGKPLSPKRWYRIRASHVDIIFRGNLQREAQRTANTLEHLYKPVTQSLGVQPDKISLVLRNQKITPNAFVTLVPRSMAFFTFPTQDYNMIGTSDWLTLLAVHEFRHVAQFARLKQNFNQLVYRIGGDCALGNIIFMNVPLWFLEGDTVGIETALTQSGRGRIPYFSLLHKTNLLENRDFSYAKQTLGSFKDPVPDYYSVGYYLVTHLRRKYGPNVLADICQGTTLPRYFHTAVKRRTGKSLLQIHQEANRELKGLWQAQLKGLQVTPSTRLNRRCPTEVYTTYLYPQLDKEGNVVVLKSGMDMVEALVSLDRQGKERTLWTPGTIHKGVGISIAQNKIVWVEEIPDPIWEGRSYGVIQHYDLSSKRLKTLTHKSRYGSAALSPDATKIVAFESDEAYNHRLVILDAENGQVLRRLPNLDNHFYLTPKWSEDGKQIVVVKNVQRSVTIALIDVATGATKDLLPYSTEPIGCPVMQGQYVFYNSAYSGIDNIYAVDLATHQRYQVTSRKYGAYNPTISHDGRWLLFNDFTRNGMDVSRMPLDPKQWIPLAQVEDRSIHYYAPLVVQEGHSEVLEKIPHHTYPVEPYHPWKHGFNVHSWCMIKDVAWNTKDLQKSSELLQEVALDVLQSRDLLDTQEFIIDYRHNFKEKWGQAAAALVYKGWYPIISLKGALKGKYQEKMAYDRMLSLKLGAPLTLQRGQYTYKSELYTEGTLHNNDDNTWYTQDYGGSFQRISKKSLRDIYSPWAQTLTIAHQHMPYGENREVFAFCTKLTTHLYFPGLVKHHSFQVFGKYVYSKKTPGFSVKSLEALQPNTIYKLSQFFRTKNASLGVRYAFPLCYPDWNVGAWFYLKRLRAEAGYELQRTSIVKEECSIASLPHTTHENYQIVGPSRIQQSPCYQNTIQLTAFADLNIFPGLTLPMLSLGVQFNYDIGKRGGTFLPVLRLTYAPLILGHVQEM